MNRISARNPSFPSEADAGADAMPATRLPTTSGITVIRIALMKIVPSGSIHLAMSPSSGLPLVETNRPSASPATSAIRTRVVSDMADQGIGASRVR